MPPFRQYPVPVGEPIGLLEHQPLDEFCIESAVLQVDEPAVAQGLAQDSCPRRGEVDQVYGSPGQYGEVSDERGLLVSGKRRGTGDRQIDVAIAPRPAARDRAEQQGQTHGRFRSETLLHCGLEVLSHGTRANTRRGWVQIPVSS
jgi:hypothetical protein